MRTKAWHISFAAVILCAYANELPAHSPHDSIAYMAVSPDYQDDGTVFIGVMGQPQRSIDGGLTWHKLKNGLDHNSLIAQMAISPAFATDGVVYAVTRGDGVYISRSHGDNWRRLENQPGIQALAHVVLSPNYAVDQTIAVAGEDGGIAMSLDGGRSWSTVLDRDRTVNSITMVEHVGTASLVALMESGEIRYLRTGSDDWVPVVLPAGEKAHFAKNPVGGPGGEALFIATDAGTYLTRDLGETYERMNYPAGGLGEHPGLVQSVAAFSSDRENMRLIVSAWFGGAYIGETADGTWQPQVNGLTTDHQADLYGRPDFRELAVRGSTILFSAFDGLFRSDDGGSTWYQLETLTSNAPTSLAVIEDVEGADKLFLTTYDAGVFASQDSGSTWTNWNLGLRNTHVWSIVARGNAPDPGYRVYAATNESIYNRSERDQKWRENMLGCKGVLESRSDFERAWDRLKARFFDPEKCRATFPHQLKISSHAEFESALMFFATRYEGIFRSDNGGQDWENVHDGLGAWVSALALSPALPKDGTLFATVRGKGVLRSTDNGDQWQQVASAEILQILAKYPNTGVPIAISPNFGDDGTVFMGTPEGLFRSDDRGESWRRMRVVHAGAEREAALAIAFSPDYRSDGEVFVSIKGHGLFVSNDSGTSFRAIAEELLDNNEIPISLYIGNRMQPEGRLIYAITEENLLRSDNGGLTWRRFDRPARFESSSETLLLSGDWKTSRSNRWSEMSAIRSEAPGSSASLSFRGSKVTVLGGASRDGGVAAVYIDEELAGRINFYSADDSSTDISAGFETADHGRHTLRIEVTGERPAGSGGSLVTLDAIDVE